MIKGAPSKLLSHRQYAHGTRHDHRRHAGDRVFARPLTWLNLVCLDAPLVAVSWQWLFAESFGIPTQPSATCALFLTAWLIYLADRFGDSRSLNPAAATSLRQRFCSRHRATWLTGMSVVAIVDAIVIGTQLEAHQLRWGAVLGICAVAYLLANRRSPRLWEILPLKEVTIGVLFAAGTLVPLASGVSTTALPAWLLFACLCALNCVSIAAWERFLDVAQQRISVATAFPRIGSYLPIALPLLSGLAVTTALSKEQPVEVYFCIASSAFLLTLVHACRSRIPQDARTALADLVLLTPLAVPLLEFVS